MLRMIVMEFPIHNRKISKEQQHLQTARWVMFGETTNFIRPSRNLYRNIIIRQHSIWVLSLPTASTVPPKYKDILLTTPGIPWLYVLRVYLSCFQSVPKHLITVSSLVE